MKDIKTQPKTQDIKVRDVAALAPKELSKLMKDSATSKLRSHDTAQDSSMTDSTAVRNAVGEFEGDVKGVTAYGSRKAYLAGKTLAQKRYDEQFRTGKTAKQADHSFGTGQPADFSGQDASRTVRAKQEYRKSKAKQQENRREMKERTEQGESRALHQSNVPSSKMVSTSEHRAATAFGQSGGKTPTVPKEKMPPQGGKTRLFTKRSKVVTDMPKSAGTSPAARAKVYATRKMQRQIAKEAAQKSTQTAKTSAKGLSRLKNAVVRAGKAIVRAAVGLLGGAGGLIALVLVIGGAAAVVGTPFGVFWSGQDADAQSVPQAVATINAEFAAKINQIQAEHPADSVVIHRVPSGGNDLSITNWTDIVAVFAVKTAGADADATDVVTMDDERIDLLCKIFWDMNAVSWRIEVIPGGEDESDTTILHITITSKTAEEMPDIYRFNKSQRQALDEMLKSEYAQMLAELVIAVNDRFDSGQYEEDTGGMEIAFTYFMNEFYSRDLSVKSKSAKYAKMRRGEYQSKICCYGYRKGSDGRMEVDPEAAKMVKEIYALAAQGRTITQIIQYLYAEKVPTPGEYKAMQGIQTYDISRCNYAWDRTRLLSMLRDERYIGTYIIGKRTVREVGSSRVRMKNESEWFKIPDHHPAIVEKAVFEQVQAILPSFKCPKKAERSYALRGKVFCGCCDHALSRNAKKIPNFYCRYAITLPDSHHGGIQIDDAELEAALFAMIAKQAQIILNMDSITDVSQLSIQTERMTEYERQIQARQAEKRRLYERYICREISLQTYQAEKSVQNEEETQLRSCYTRLSQKVQQTQMSREQQTTQRRLASDVQAQSTLTRELADTLIDRVTVYPDNQIEVCWKLKDFCT